MPTKTELTKTFRDLVSIYQQSPHWRGLAELTKADYIQCIKALETLSAWQFQLNGTPRSIMNVDLDEWTPGLLRFMSDARSIASVSRANHEMDFIKRVWTWGYQRDLVGTNLPRGISRIHQEPRKRYVPQDEYGRFILFCARYGNVRIVPACELAYLCRLRLCEVLDLRKEFATIDGLLTPRRKGSKDALNVWTERLRDAVDAAFDLSAGRDTPWLIPGKGAERYTEQAFKTAWQRIQRRWQARGNERFTFHDLKRAGVSDTAGDKMAASGHRSARMLTIYDVLPTRIDPTS